MSMCQINYFLPLFSFYINNDSDNTSNLKLSFCGLLECLDTTERHLV